MQFTDKYIQALKPKAKSHDVREKNGKGFTVRVFPSGQKSWVFFYFFEGRKRRMTLGSYPDLSLAKARIEHRNALNLLAIGKDPGLTKQNERLAARISSSVEDLIEEYLEKWAKPRKRSWKEDQRILYKDIRPTLGKRKAKDVTKRDVILVLDKIKERNAPIAANRTLACVRRMFNFAIERDIVTTNPCITVKAPTKENKRDRCLTSEEIKSFWYCLDEAPMSEITKLVLKLQLVTGQRKGELITAEWGELDIIGGWWTIPAHKAKNGHLHRVPLSSLALELINALKQFSSTSRWLFPSKNGAKFITGASIDHAVRRSTFKNMKPFTPHDLRRTAASHMTSLGIPRLVVSKILNHIEHSVTAIYDRHTYDNEKQQALDMWSRQINRLISDAAIKSNVIVIKKIA